MGFGFMGEKSDGYISMKNKCSIDGCGKLIHCKNLCNCHYRRLMKYGNPLLLKNREQGQGTPHNSGYWAFEINKRPILRHVLMAEKAIGKTLFKGVEVHHVDLNRSNDDHINLVICQNRAYHQLLHKRTKALRECGNAHWIKCQICKIYSPPEELRIYSNGVKWHPNCWANKFGRRKNNVIQL